MTIVPRRQWTAGLANPSAGKDPAWVSGGTSRRPSLLFVIQWIAIHYTGVAAKYIGRDPLRSMRDLFMAVNASKGDEYSFAVTWDGQVFEWAGLYRAAHCTFWNSRSIGILLVLGIGEAPTPAMLAAVAELRAWLVAQGAAVREHRVGPHHEYLGTQPPNGPNNDGKLAVGDGTAATWYLPVGAPIRIGPWPVGTGAYTSCWGTAVATQRAALTAPLPPIPTPPPEEDDMAAGDLIEVTDHPNYPPGLKVMYVSDPFGVSYRWIQSEANLAGVKADRLRRGQPTTHTPCRFADLGRYGVLIGPTP